MKGAYFSTACFDIFCRGVWKVVGVVGQFHDLPSVIVYDLARFTGHDLSVTIVALLLSSSARGYVSILPCGLNCTSSETDLLRRFFSIYLWHIRLPSTSTPRTFITPCYAIRYPTYSKMFVGGLNWDTTDGIQRRTHNQLTVLLTTSMRCACASLLSRRSEGVFHRVWQGNRGDPFLPQKDLVYLTESLWKVDACTIMRDPETGRSRGFAFLTFEDPSSVNAVMVREHYLDGKAVRAMVVFTKLYSEWFLYR